MIVAACVYTVSLTRKVDQTNSRDVFSMKWKSLSVKTFPVPIELNIWGFIINATLHKK